MKHYIHHFAEWGDFGVSLVLDEISVSANEPSCWFWVKVNGYCGFTYDNELIKHSSWISK